MRNTTDANICNNNVFVVKNLSKRKRKRPFTNIYRYKQENRTMGHVTYTKASASCMAMKTIPGIFLGTMDWLSAKSS